ncbi:MAG: ImmA/IrrE family metallo-endopeptidase [bacterium]
MVRTEYMPDYVSPPGETLQEVLDSRGMSQVNLAQRTGRSPKHINELIKGKVALTPDTALQFERALGIPASFWSHRENHYQAYQARLDEQKRLQSCLNWLKQIPTGAMMKYGWIPRLKDRIEQFREVLNFFAVASPDQWNEMWNERLDAVQLRQSNVSTISKGAIAAWLRKGEIGAHDVDCEPYSAEKLRQSIVSIRELSRLHPSEFKSELQRICAQSGVAVVYTREIPQTGISGATQWLSPKKALLQLSFRYKRDDQFWFSFFHEVGHILKHGKNSFFVELPGIKSKREKEADRFAANMLIPHDDFKRFKEEYTSYSNMHQYPLQPIKAFADKMQIAPGIVVGRLQHEGILLPSHGNGLKQVIDWENEDS